MPLHVVLGQSCCMHVYPDDFERPMAYASRSLTSAEVNYGQIEKECLALIYGVQKFHQFVYGRSHASTTFDGYFGFQEGSGPFRWQPISTIWTFVGRLNTALQCRWVLKGCLSQLARQERTLKPLTHVK